MSREQKRRMGWNLQAWVKVSACASMFLTTPAWGVGESLGSIDHPFEAAGSFTYFGDTTDPGLGGNDIDRYACASDKNEAGREVVFKVELAEASDIDVVVETPSSAVDVDVHILSALSVSGGVASSCLDRDDKNAATFGRPAGTYFIVADTYVNSGGPRPGPFKLFVRVYPTNGVTRTELADGVWWNRSTAVIGSGTATLQWIDVDPTRGARVEVVYNNECQTVHNADKPAGTVAALNAGFFAGSTCAPANFLRTQGTTRKLSTGVEHVVGLGADGAVGFGKPQDGQDFNSYTHGVGGRGFFRLQASGVTVDNDGTSGDFVAGRHPRTVVVSRTDGTLGLYTIDGRTGAGVGASLGEVGNLLHEMDRGLALNLDGGGSTTLWVKGESMSGVVNYPSDNNAADHAGARAVGSFLAVVGNERPMPLFVSLPPPGVVLKDGDTFRYSPRFATGAPQLSVQANGAPLANAQIVDGDLVFAPSDRQNGFHRLTIKACFDAACSEQHVPVKVELERPYVEPEPTGPTGPSATGPSAPQQPSGPSVPVQRPDETGKPQATPVVATPKSGCQAAPEPATLWWLLGSVTALVVRRRVNRS